MKQLIVILLLISTTFSASAQAEAASSYNKYQVVHEGRTYTQMGKFRVLGTPYLFGKKHLGNLFAKGETGLNLYLSYNAFNQQVEFTSSANPEQPLIKEAAYVDSFLLKRDSLIASDMFFVNGELLGSKEKQFFHRVVDGEKFALYKGYKNTLEVVSTNYVDADLRQFELLVDYYYYDKSKKAFKKLKVNSWGLKKEFSFAKNIDQFADSYRINSDKEGLLKDLFAEINQ